MEYADAWLTVPVFLNGHADTLRFIVDTGASVSCVSRSTAERLGLPSRGRRTAFGASGEQTMSFVGIAELRIGDILARRFNALVLDDATITPHGGARPGYTALDGVLGVDVLNAFDVVISAPDRELVLYEPGTAPAALLADFGAEVAMDPSGQPLIHHDVLVNGQTVRGILDTGSRRTVVNGRAAGLAGIEGDAASSETRSPGVGSRGVVFMDAYAETLEMGGMTLLDVPMQVADMPVFEAFALEGRAAILMGARAVAGCPVFVSYREQTIRYCRVPITPAF